MTVQAPPTDPAGAALMAQIANVQSLVNSARNERVKSAQIQLLNSLQEQAVDHFMATYWLSADSILAAIPPPANNWTADSAIITADSALETADGGNPITQEGSWTADSADVTADSAFFTADSGVSGGAPVTRLFMILPAAGDAYVMDMLARIAARAAQVMQILANGIPVPNPLQYSRSYSLVVTPDTYWYALQMQLIDYCMNKAILPASAILATMTGFQTYPFNYVSNYTYYQTDLW